MNGTRRGTNNPVKVSVVGTGYLGATHAACLSALGHDVVGIDCDPRRAEALAHGRLPFHEPGLAAVLGEGLASGRLRFTTDLDSATTAQVHFICVGTPQRPGSQQADLSYVWDVVAALGPRLRRPCLVVGKSTVPVGTAARIADRLRTLAPVAGDAEVAWNPEFLREGHAVEDSLSPDRLVFGVQSDEADQILRDLYASLIARGIPVVRTDLATAELAKASANVMLATRVSLVNLLAEVCEAADADVGDLIEVLGHDARIGPLYLRPGVGYGGGCLPKDTRAFIARAAELGVVESGSLLREVDALNMRQRARTVDLTRRLLDRSPAESSVAVLGAAFKAGSDDVRDSPALDIATTLHRQGVSVRVYDPAALESARRVRPELAYTSTLHDACQDADVTLVLTEWAEFSGVDPVSLADVVRRPVVVDGRLVLDADKWRAAGWRVHALGRGPRSAPA